MLPIFRLKRVYCNAGAKGKRGSGAGGVDLDSSAYEWGSTAGDDGLDSSAASYKGRLDDEDGGDEACNDPWEAAWDRIMDGNSAMRAAGIQALCSLLRSSWDPEYVELR